MYGVHLLLGIGLDQNIIQGMEYIRRVTNPRWDAVVATIGKAGLLCQVDTSSNLPIVIECYIQSAKQIVYSWLLLCFLQPVQSLLSRFIVAVYFCCEKLESHHLESGLQCLNSILDWFQFTGCPGIVIMESGDILSVTQRRDVIFALEKLRLVADNGNATAQHLMGWCLITGFGCPVSRREGIQYIQLSADQKDPRALLAFGTICRDGRWNAPICLSAAADYLIEAAAVEDSKIACMALHELAITLARKSPIRRWLMTESCSEGHKSSRGLTRRILAKFGRRFDDSSSSKYGAMKLGSSVISIWRQLLIVIARPLSKD
jgi:hypothetical protein